MTSRTRLRRYEYAVTRETGGHMRLTTQHGGEHHITIPDHDDLRLILADVATHLGIDRTTLAEELFAR